MRKKFLIAILGAGLSFGATNGSPTAMADAAAHEDWAGVRAMVAQKANVDTPQVDGTTALHWASHFDDLDMVKSLLAAGADARVSNRYGVTPLSEACVNGNAEIIVLLLKAGADANAPHAEGETPLMTAARTGNPAAVKVLLDNHAQVNVAEEWRGQTALMWAASEGHSEVVKLLLANGAAIDAKSKVFDFTQLKPKAGSVGMNFPRGGFTPLLFAARDGQMDSVKALIEAGADVNLTDPDNTSALVMAIINFHYDIAGYLMDHGADVNTADSKGRAPLYAAIDMRNMDVTTRPSIKVDDKLNPFSLAKLLLDHEADPNGQLLKPVTARGVLDGADGTMGAGSTPFLRAARSSDLESIKLLLEHGADPKIATKDGVDAVMMAAGIAWRDGKTRASEADSVTAIKMLVGMGLPVNGATVRSGETALHGAAGRGADEVVQALVDLKADVNAKDKTSRTPIDVANAIGASVGGVRAPHETTVALLAKLGGVTGQSPTQTANTLVVPPAPEVNPSVVIKSARIPAEKTPASASSATTKP